jgi:hypothetical protein
MSSWFHFELHWHCKLSTHCQKLSHVSAIIKPYGRFDRELTFENFHLLLVLPPLGLLGFLLTDPRGGGEEEESQRRRRTRRRRRKMSACSAFM